MYSFKCKLYINNIKTKSYVFQHFCTKVMRNQKDAKQMSHTTHKKTYGQPTSESHPHLIKPGEITPNIKKSEFQERRQRLMEKIVSHSLQNNKNAKDHIVVIPSATKRYMSDKIPYFFRQNSDYLYLTGCQEPDTCLVITTTDSLQKFNMTLFVRERDGYSELWDGPRTDPDDAAEFFGVDQGLPMSELQHFVSDFMKPNKGPMLWYNFLTPVQHEVHKIMKDYMNDAINNVWDSPIPFIHKLRLIKSPAEIALMQESCNVASDAIVKTIISSKPGMTEHQIFAKVDYECRMKGAEFLAYPPVVAGGDRATIIHYINNNQVVRDGEMVLMDAGCEYHGYSSDITRVWPINGRFTPHQQVLYEIVETVQANLIQLCNKFPSLDRLFEAMCVLLGKYLQEVGLIPKSATASEAFRAAFMFCPHHVSHYLGMDVHDTPSIPRNINIVPGMIITIEPGIYINEKMNVPKEFHGLGIRIEDDVLITKNGPVVLSKKCPKQCQEMENIASKNLQ